MTVDVDHLASSPPPTASTLAPLDVAALVDEVLVHQRRLALSDLEVCAALGVTPPTWLRARRGGVVAPHVGRRLVLGAARLSAAPSRAEVRLG